MERVVGEDFLVEGTVVNRHFPGEAREVKPPKESLGGRKEPRGTV